MHERWGLNCSLCIYLEGEPQFYTPHGELSPLEAELITKIRNKDRFFDFGCRTQINYPNISLLIKNMPLEDPERYGRIKDLFPFILAAYDAKIKNLNIEHVIKEQSFVLNQSFLQIRETISNLARSLAENAQSGHMVLSNMLNELTHHPQDFYT